MKEKLLECAGYTAIVVTGAVMFFAGFGIVVKVIANY